MSCLITTRKSGCDICHSVPCLLLYECVPDGAWALAYVDCAVVDAVSRHFHVFFYWRIHIYLLAGAGDFSLVCYDKRVHNNVLFIIHFLVFLAIFRGFF